MYSVAHVSNCNDPDLQIPRPQLILLNIQSARVGDSLVRDDIGSLRQRFGDVPVTVLTDRDDSAWAVEAIRSGLRGYIPMSLSIDIMVAAARLILAGGTFVPLGVVNDFASLSAAREPRERSTANAEVDSGDMGLTDRESQVLKGLQQGKANKIIAYELRISENTVKVHVQHIMKKLNATNRTQVALLVRQAGGAPKADQAEVAPTRDKGDRRRPGVAQLTSAATRECPVA